MIEWGRGAKAGLVAGGTWGIITAVETAVTSSPVGIVLIFVLLRIAWGFLLGLVFAAIADRFMLARNYRVKGFLYGLILGIIELALNLGALAIGAANVDFSLGFNLGVGLVSASLVGSLLGFSYEKLGLSPHS